MVEQAQSLLSTYSSGAAYSPDYVAGLNTPVWPRPFGTTPVPDAEAAATIQDLVRRGFDLSRIGTPFDEA